MEYRFRYQPRNGSRVILDVPAIAHVSPAQIEDGEVATFHVDRVLINGVEVPRPTGLHDDVFDHIEQHHAREIERILARAVENATAIARAIG